MSKQEPYVYSLDGEEWREREPGKGWETRDEALAEGRAQSKFVAELKSAPPSPVWTGVKVGYQASAFYPDADLILEEMHSRARFEVGNDVDGWLDSVSTPPKQDLSESDDPPPKADPSPGRELADFVEDVLHPFLDQWVQKHRLEPEFWSVTEICKHADDDTGVATR